MIRPWVRRVTIATTIVVGLYLAVCVLACSAYRALLYPAPSDYPKVASSGASTLRTFRASDGVEVHALVWKASAGARTVVLFHGNGATIGGDTDVGEWLHARGMGVMLVEYRGYGISSPGKPTEDGLYADAAAALDGLSADGIPPSRIVLWGTSLGTGVASEMARRKKGASLVLVSPFTSIPKLAARFAPLLPVGLIIGDRFDTLARAADITVPTLVIHGTEDEIVPYDMGVRVAKAIAGARLITVPGGHHNDLFAIDGLHLLDAIVEHASAGAN